MSLYRVLSRPFGFGQFIEKLAIHNSMQDKEVDDEKEPKKSFDLGVASHLA